MTFVPMKDDPILNVKWVLASSLSANGWNPNVVLNQELKLLEFSILKNGWIQPILISSALSIIDGFHRWSLSRQSKALMERYSGHVPAVVMDITQAQAKLLTVRINRAKGTHVAFRMHELIRSLIDEEGMTADQIEQEIGAYKGEVALLYQESVFKAKDIQNHEYSKAWEPRKA